jgi:hypothetical protein
MTKLQGLLDDLPPWDELPASEPVDRSSDADFLAFIEQAARDAVLREKQAQTEADAIALCEDIDGVILPYIQPEHCIPGVTVGNRVSRLTGEDWKIFNKAKAFCAEYGANVDRGRWPLSAQGIVAFLARESATNDTPEHLRKVRNAISKVTRALLDSTEEPIVRATLTKLCERTDEDKPEKE